jgi:thioredoxin 1
MKPTELTDATFQDFIATADKPVLVDFWASWCGPCRAMAPILEEIADEEEARLIVAKVNTDENPRTAGGFGIASIPTMILFKDGKPVGSLIGARPKESVMAAIGQYL